MFAVALHSVTGTRTMIRIVVVDDALTERTIAGGLLQKALDCDVRYAESGVSAVELIEDRAPDLIVTDLNMPKMDGLELVETVRENWPEIPVIVMTAMGSEETAARAMRNGAASYVPKRRLAQDLVLTVRQVLAARRLSSVPERALSHMERCTMQFRLRNDLRLLADTASLLQRLLVCLPLGSEGERTRVAVAVEAALSNAMLRGNLELPRIEGQSEDELAARIQDRQLKLPYRDRQITVDVDVSRERAIFTIRDEGPGFDVTAIDRELTRLDAGTHVGRGLALMHTIMDSVVFNTAGNEVMLTRHRCEEPEADDDAD